MAHRVGSVSLRGFDRDGILSSRKGAWTGSQVVLKLFVRVEWMDRSDAIFRPVGEARMAILPCALLLMRQKQQRKHKQESCWHEDGMNVGHLESPNQRNQCHQIEISSSGPKTGPPAPGCLSSGRLCKAHVRIDESGGWNGSPVRLAIRVSGSIKQKRCAALTTSMALWPQVPWSHARSVYVDVDVGVDV